MLKVIIADDEARVCSLIRMLIDWDALGMELAGIASNGFEALELIRACQPDILITDIRMPGCHGLELIERAKAFDPQLEIAIISGYAHFEYAQSAIRFGVGDYLLKPINQQELMGTLRKLGERRLSRQRLGSEVEQLRISSREDQRQLHGRLLQDVMDNPSMTLTDDLLWDRYRFRAQPGLWQAAMLVADYDAQDTPAASVRIAEEKAVKALVSELGAVCHTLLTHAQEGCCGALLGFDPAQAGEVRKRLRLCLNQLNVKSGLIGGMEYTMALSGSVHSILQAPGACAAAQSLRFERLIQGAGRLIECGAHGSGVAQETLLRRYREAVGEPAERLDQEKAARAVEQLRINPGRDFRSAGRQHIHSGCAFRAAGQALRRVPVPVRPQGFAHGHSVLSLPFSSTGAPVPGFVRIRCTISSTSPAPISKSPTLARPPKRGRVSPRNHNGPSQSTSTYSGSAPERIRSTSDAYFGKS